MTSKKISDKKLPAQKLRAQKLRDRRKQSGYHAVNALTRLLTMEWVILRRGVGEF